MWLAAGSTVSVSFFHYPATTEIYPYLHTRALHDALPISGVRHSEYNLENETTTLFQIWIIPRSAGGSPSWGAKPFPKDDRSGKFMVLASGYEADEGALKIGADARVLGATDRKSTRLNSSH